MFFFSLNNKPWITKELKTYLNEQNPAFIRGYSAEVRELKREFRRKAKVDKLADKDKVEEKLEMGNAKTAWKELNIMMGRKQKP